MVRIFADTLRDRFSAQIADNPRSFKERVIRLLRESLPQRRGRPRDPKIDEAWQMVRQGKTVSEVLGAQNPKFHELDPYIQWLAKKGLYQAIRRRRRAEISGDRRDVSPGV